VKCFPGELTEFKSNAMAYSSISSKSYRIKIIAENIAML